MNESCHRYGSVMSLWWMSHITLMNVSHHTSPSSPPPQSTCERVTSCHVHESRHTSHTHMTLLTPSQSKSSCHTYEWVMSHLWMSHVTHMQESRRTICMSHGAPYEWVMSQNIYESHRTLYIFMSFVTQYVWVMSHNTNVSRQTICMSHGTPYECVTRYAICMPYELSHRMMQT